ncbi:MAG: 2-oxoacid:acceptor oxidoreductase subunit alpha [Methanobacteriota archaeon]|nr:MAG: 2-oxoacid:acceptor oxidoreductase subunit alpha [Euryarchaeota archaeon]
MPEEEVFLQGNEAVVEGALRAGCRFYAGYPICPSTGILETMVMRLPEVGGTVIQMEDEISSIAAVIGAAWGGAKAMTATSGPGFSLMQENLGYAVITETPCVIVDAQRSGPSTGQPTLPSHGDIMQARWGTHGSHSIIALAPSNVQECYDLTIEAFNLSEKYRTPVVLLSDGELAHMRERIVLKDLPIVNREEFPKGPVTFPLGEELGGVSPFPTFGRGHRTHVTGLTHTIVGYPSESIEVQTKLLTRLIGKISDNRKDICKYEVHNPKAEHLIVAYGIPARSAMELVTERADIGLFQPLTIWPFPSKAFRRAAEGKKSVLVVEMNEGHIFREVERHACRAGVEEIELCSKLGGGIPAPEEMLDCISAMEGE